VRLISNQEFTIGTIADNHFMRLLLTNIILAFFIVTSFGQKTKSYDFMAAHPQA
jgi:hypothetical protein